MGKDIFISYRREGGEHLALLIYHQLRHDGYSVFLDVESLRKGKFDEALFERIREARDFILILPPRGLDRCASPEDWVRQEIEFAIREKKNIIPIMMEGFDNWPKDLPETMAPVQVFNGLRNHQGYFGDMIRKLEKGFLESVPRMQSAPTENTEEDGEILEKCQQCGSDRVICEDPLPRCLFALRVLRRAIHWWICLAPLAFCLIMLLGAAGEEDIRGLQVLGINLSFLLENPFAQHISFGPDTLLHFVLVMASLLLMGNSAYRYTETPSILGKETASRSVTVTCRRCATKRRIEVSAEVLGAQRSEKAERYAGFLLFLLVSALLTACFNVLLKLDIMKDGADQFACIFAVLVLLALAVGYLTNKICGYLNAMPDKTLLQYLKTDFHLFEKEDDGDSDNQVEPSRAEPLEFSELKLHKPRKKE